MRAVVVHVDNPQAFPPPPELELVWSSRMFGGLPEAGGLLDQPAGLLRRMRMTANLYDAYHEYRDYIKLHPGCDGDFASKYPSLWAIVQKALQLKAAQ